MKGKTSKNDQVAIRISNVSKSFKIPHEKIDTLRGSFVNFLKRKTFEQFKALDRISFEIKKGEFFGIIGRNGSGKSTLLKIMAGIYEPDEGKVDVNGEISPFLELGVGFNPELSGRDNIYLNASVLGMNQKQIDEVFDKIVAFSELERFIDQKLKNYSSGMQVRLAFSVAIHANKSILLMDEVLAVGDNNFQQKCLREFKRYKKQGKTVILVTHDLNVVERYCDRAMLLRKGKIEEIGAITKVMDKYVYQNMSDEERRIMEEERKKHKENKAREKMIKELKSKKAEITKLETLTQAGEKKQEFNTSEAVVIRIHYKTSQKINDPVFGISLDTADGFHITGPNTRRSGLKLDYIEGEGTIDLVLQDLPLNREVYYLKVGIFNWDDTYSYYYKERVASFKIITNNVTQDGPINIKHKWII